jgi:hypothetical protein
MMILELELQLIVNTVLGVCSCVNVQGWSTVVEQRVNGSNGVMGLFIMGR